MQWRLQEILQELERRVSEKNVWIEELERRLQEVEDRIERMEIETRAADIKAKTLKDNEERLIMWLKLKQNESEAKPVREWIRLMPH